MTKEWDTHCTICGKQIGGNKTARISPKKKTVTHIYCYDADLIGPGKSDPRNKQQERINDIDQGTS